MKDAKEVPYDGNIFYVLSQRALFFLIPLKLVRHIVQGNAGQEKTITFNGCEAEIYSVGASLGGQPGTGVCGPSGGGRQSSGPFG